MRAWGHRQMAPMTLRQVRRIMATARCRSLARGTRGTACVPGPSMPRCAARKRGEGRASARPRRLDAGRAADQTCSPGQLCNGDGPQGRSNGGDRAMMSGWSGGKGRSIRAHPITYPHNLAQRPHHLTDSSTLLSPACGCCANVGGDGETGGVAGGFTGGCAAECRYPDPARDLGRTRPNFGHCGDGNGAYLSGEEGLTSLPDDTLAPYGDDGSEGEDALRFSDWRTRVFTVICVALGINAKKRCGRRQLRQWW